MGFWQTTVVVLVTAFLTWIGHAIVSALQARAERDKALAAEKRDAYKRLLGLMFGILAATKANEAEKKMPAFQDEFFALIRDMTVYAPDDVLRLFISLKNQKPDADPHKVIALLADIILSIRRDLGHDATTVTRKELLSSFITDVEKLNVD